MGTVRDKIIAATDRLLNEEGAGQLSTRAIAKAAGCSDGALYKHFESLDDLLVEVFRQKLPSFAALSQLPLKVGENEVIDNLCEVMVAGLGFVRAAMPMWLALATDTPLRNTYFRRLTKQGGGPHVAVEGIAAYLRAEQRLKRVSPHLDALTIAQMMLASMVSHALLERVMGELAPKIDTRVWASEISNIVSRATEKRSVRRSRLLR